MDMASNKVNRLSAPIKFVLAAINYCSVTLTSLPSSVAGVTHCVHNYREDSMFHIDGTLL